MTKENPNKTLTALAVIYALPSIEERIGPACALAAPAGHRDIVTLFRQWAGEKRKFLSRADCQLEGAWGATSQSEKEKAGILRSFLDGKKRLISVNSFYEHLITRVILSHPVDGSSPKGTATSTQFRAASERKEGRKAVSSL
ncbi:MAG TPA: hypothetical protein VFE60_13960 [Roseiarcus sp.]|jgi:hypothetical protein|nr:hypothetical protein [Roseiarcus sp.]